MALVHNLTLITLVVATMSMLLSAMALWPQWKHGLAFIRDAVLWTALVVVVIGVATIGWRNYRISNQKVLAPAQEFQQVSVAYPEQPTHWPQQNDYNQRNETWRQSR